MGWWNNFTDFVSDTASSVGRTIEVGAQGLVRGVASGVSSVGDLAVNVGYNWTTRHAINAFREDDLQSYNSNFAGRAANAVTWTEARNNYERTIMTAGQVVGEVGSFVAVTVATGGLGGAAVGGSIAAARGTAIGARAISAGGHAASATARFLNPMASRTALAAEGGFGAYRGYELFTEDAEAAETAEEIKTEAATEALDSARAEQQAINNSLQRVSAELTSVLDELGGDISAERRNELLERLDQLDEHNNVINELRQEGLSPERREQLWDRLKELDPQVEQELLASQAPEENSLSARFANAEGEQVATAEQEETIRQDGPAQRHLVV